MEYFNGETYDGDLQDGNTAGYVLRRKDGKLTRGSIRDGKFIEQSK